MFNRTGRLIETLEYVSLRRYGDCVTNTSMTLGLFVQFPCFVPGQTATLKLEGVIREVRGFEAILFWKCTSKSVLPTVESRLEPHPGFFRLLMKGIMNEAYVL